MEREPKNQEGGHPDFFGRWTRPVRFLATIGGYAVAGWWSFRFAGSLSLWIPFWLPSGIGVVILLVWGAGYWPAVFLGAAISFFIEFQNTFGGGDLVWIVGIGAAAQVAGNLVAVALIRLRVRWPNDIGEGRKAVGFYLAGGVAGPLVSAAVWAFGWLRAGVFPPGTLVYTMAILFLASAIGFCLVAPLLLAMAKPMAELWEGRKARFGIPLAVVLVAAVALLAYVCGSMGRHMQADFRELTGRMASRIGGELSEISEALESVRSFWDGSVKVDRNEFAIVSRRYLERHPGLLFLAWAPVIRAEDSEKLTEWIRSEAASDANPERRLRVAGFSIHGGGEGETGGDTNVAPVVYLEPMGKDLEWFGFNLAANEEFRRTIEQARNLGVPVSPNPDVLEEQGIRGGLEFLWLERESKPDSTGENWLTDHSGIAMAVIDAGSIVTGVMKEFAAVPVEISIADVTGIDSEDGEDRGEALPPFLVCHDRQGHPEILRGIGRVSHLILFANRQWELEFDPGAELIPSMLSWEVPAVQSGVLLVSSLLGVLLLVTTGYTLRMEREVRERTRKLAEAEEDLRRSNAELEQFAYIASHDLREPLRMVTSFVQLLKRRYGGKMGEDADEYIRHAVEGTERMRDLIQGLLELSRIGTRGHPLTEIDAGDALKNALDNLRVAIEESGARIESEPLPIVLADRMQLTQLFQNLIGNAIKFNRGENPVIEISAIRDGGFWQFSVRDNGPGIPEEHRDRVFQIFQRLEPRQGGVEGTGIGLAVCRRIVERHGGEISVYGREGGGSEFRFTISAEEKP